MSAPAGGIRILLADKHPAIRRGLRHLLTACTDMEVVGEAADQESVLQSAQALRPDVMVLDMHLGQPCGFALARKMRSAIPALRIVLLASFGGEGDTEWALASGAHACLHKWEAADTLAETIREIVR